MLIINFLYYFCCKKYTTDILNIQNNKKTVMRGNDVVL